MSEKTIVVEINEDGTIHAETNGFSGTDCVTELDKLMKDIARLNSRTKKAEYYEEKRTENTVIKNTHA